MRHDFVGCLIRHCRLVNYYQKGIVMGITQKISDDQSAIASAQSALDAANAALAADQAVLAALQPHIAAWDAVEAFATTMGDDIKAQLTQLVANGRAALDL